MRLGGLRGRVKPDRWRQVSELVRSGVAAPLTTSAGRLFDAVAALAGVRSEVSYEGQAAIELEALADPGETGAYPLPVGGAEPTGAPLVIDARPTVREVAGDVERGVPAPRVSARFHNALATAVATACERAAARSGVYTVVLSGGVFQNRLLLGRSAGLLRKAGLRVLIPERLPANDGGISYGQLAVAAARLAGERGNGDVRA